MRYVALILAVGIAAGGCRRTGLFGQSEPPITDPQPHPASVEAVTSGPTSRPADSEVMAYVNGSPVYMVDLYELLLREQGPRLARHLVANELVNQAAGRENLTADAEEVRLEHEQAIEQMFPGESDANQLEWLLEQLLARKQFSREQWWMTMRRNVLLGKLAEPDVQIIEDELHEEFANRYGRKMVVRHIQSATLSEAQEVLERLGGGADFAELARKVSKNASASSGGLLPPIGATVEGLPSALREAAYTMTTPGEISDPIQVQTAFHILYLEQIIEPQDVKFDDVRDKLHLALRSRKVRGRAQKMREELLHNAKIEYVNPILKTKAIESDLEHQQ